MNRIVFEGTETPIFSVYESAPVQQKIEVMRADSMSFLKKALDITILWKSLLFSDETRSLTYVCVKKGKEQF